MTLTQDHLVTIRQVLYANWNATAPSKATLGEKGFRVIYGKEPVTESPVVTVRDESESSRTISGGSTPPVLHRAIIRVGAWTTSKEHLSNMVTEIKRINEVTFYNPGGGIHHWEVSGAVPRSDSRVSKEMVAKEVRFVIVYWQ